MVSILLPSLNQGRFLPAALDSILQQSHQDLEVVVADEGSTDETLPILEHYAARDPRLRWFSGSDRGPAAAVNKAAAAATGEILGWLNADDLYAEGAIAAAVTTLSGNRNLELVYGHADFIDESGQCMGPYPTKPPPTPPEAFAEGCFICQPTVFIRRHAWQELGGLDEKFQASFDFDLWVRAFGSFPQAIGFLDRRQAFSRCHGATITSLRRETIALEGLQILRRHIGVAPEHWVLTHVEEIMAAHPDNDGRDLREKVENFLAKAGPLLEAAQHGSLAARVRRDCRLLQATPDRFLGCHPDGWVGSTWEARYRCGTNGQETLFIADTSGLPWPSLTLAVEEPARETEHHRLPTGTLHSVPLPARTDATGGVRTLRIRCGRSFQPDGDARELSFRLAEPCPHPLRQTAYASPGIAVPIHAAMLAIWHLRPALQRRFPLDGDNGRQHLRFLAWCWAHGRREYRVLRELEDWNRQLTAPVVLPAAADDVWAGGFSLAMLLEAIHVNRGSLGGILRGGVARRRGARAFWRGGRHKAAAPLPASWQRAWIRERFGSWSNFATFLRLPGRDRDKTNEELVEEFGLGDLEDGEATHEDRDAVSVSIALTGSPVTLPRALAGPLVAGIELLSPRPDESARARVMRRISPDRPALWRPGRPFGVNLFGYARGELGIGEDIRHVAQTLDAAGVPVGIIDFQPGKNISQGDRSADRLITEHADYGINLFCMTGIETVRFLCERGLGSVAGRYNIGLWPWELSDWPESCRHAYACVDEIWGISNHAAQAHRFAAPRPVLPVGLPVELGPVGHQTRRDFGLPEEDYLYTFAFDINSSAARKNPEGLIAAFQKAFPRGCREKAGLVLKVSHPETGCKLWRRIRRAARRDPRIHVVEKTMRRPELLALFNACDCFVSLHRAEGFGRCLAEALLLGKQVVATGFSGNLDFCREPRTALVRHRMIPLQKGDYMWGDGQSWADPDLDHAAELMRSVRENPRPLGNDAFPFHPDRIGPRYAARLREIWARQSRTSSLA